MLQKKSGLSLILLAILMIASSAIGAWVYKSFFSQPSYVSLVQKAEPSPIPARLTDVPGRTTESPTNFVKAADIGRPAVVHIKSNYSLRRSGKERGFFKSPFGDYFDNENDPPQGQASGSGVIISADGYIATNNHVVEDAEELEVTLFDNRTFKARIIGVDYNTDLALIKIDVQNLAHLTFGNSDKLQVGEWVLAVGNPMDLTSTVTAGIVSAKGRNINLLAGERNTEAALTIESFIQTDAAVNRGNSGGALINVEGELVGINTAIASRTGSYAGYSFAIPATLVKKVMEDLLRFGEVRRGFLGVTIQPVDADMAQKNRLPAVKGAYVSGVSRNGGAYKAGLRVGDVIISVDDQEIKSTSELQEMVSRHRPGEKVQIDFYRSGSRRSMEVRLQGKVQSDSDISYEAENEPETRQAEEDVLGIKESSFRLLSDPEKEKLGIEHGVKVLRAGYKLRKGGVQQGFVITEVNDQKIYSLRGLERVIQQSDGFVTIKGLFSKGMKASYSFSW